ncbi:MAG: chromosomal replication initiator protein DnaA [Planctomycetes bacterium]|nr:chromosomal replication initiator protein DnaA [Planctomycetota bacterium]
MNQSALGNTLNNWEEVLSEVETKIGIRMYNLWFKNVRLLSFKNDTVTIGVPNLFIQKKISNNFESFIRDSLKNVASINPSIKFHIENRVAQNEDNNKLSIRYNTDNAPKQDPAISNNKNLVLEGFIVGDCNRLAYASALEISKPGPVAFNTLFVHGPIGVGKTHLLQGIYNRLKEESANISVVYKPAENWTNEFVYSLRGGGLESFRKKYRSTDIFLVDDVHFLSNKKGVQEEFLHTFNTLHSLSKRVVFASDAHPRLMVQLKESLASRFMSGMIAKIEQPGFETSLQILRSKAAKIRKKIPENVLEFISEKFNENIRSMESALTTVLAYANINKKKIDLPLATHTLSELYVNLEKNVTLQDIERTVINYYKVSRSEIHSRNKSKNVVFARQFCMYLAKTLTDSSYQEIGKFFGNKRHTTAIFAIKKIKNRMEIDNDFRSQAESLSRKINDTASS